jgi:DNA-binding NtrC family response regulator
MNVLIIEDDYILSTSLKEYLEDENFSVKIEDSLDTNIYYISKKFDIILLDLMLKDKKGEFILKDLRKKGWPKEKVIALIIKMEASEKIVKNIAHLYWIHTDPTKILSQLPKEIIHCISLRIFDTQESLLEYV